MADDAAKPSKVSDQGRRNSHRHRLGTPFVSMRGICPGLENDRAVCAAELRPQLGGQSCWMRVKATCFGRAKLEEGKRLYHRTRQRQGEAGEKLKDAYAPVSMAHLTTSPQALATACTSTARRRSRARERAKQTCIMLAAKDSLRPPGHKLPFLVFGSTLVHCTGTDPDGTEFTRVPSV